MSQRRAYVFGGGGHAGVVASLLTAEVVFIVPKATAADHLSEIDYFAALDTHRAHPVYMGLGNNGVRRRIYDQLVAAGIRPAICIAPNAFVAGNARIGDGAVLCPGVVVNARAVVGANTIINTLSGVDHDCVIGDHTQIAPGVSFGGTVTVGANCFFGIKSAVVPNITIGRDVTVMAGSLVTKNVGDAVQVGGVPARVVKTL